MAITPTSTMYDAQSLAPVATKDVQVIAFKYVQTSGSSPTGSATVAKLPKGKISIDFSQSYILPVDASAGCLLSIGYAAHVNAKTGLPVAADPNAFLDAYDISNNPNRTLIAPPQGENPQTEFNAVTGLDITILVAGGNMDQNDTLRGWFVFRYQWD